MFGRGPRVKQIVVKLARPDGKMIVFFTVLVETRSEAGVPQRQDDRALHSARGEAGAPQRHDDHVLHDALGELVHPNGM